MVALDIPSGVDASDGTVAGAAVAAELTIAFHGPKLGLIVAPGSRHAGAVVVADIGIPPQLESPTWSALATRSLIDLVPRKHHGTTKYRAGSVLVVGGSEGMAGAPLLVARAALRAGAGVAWVAVQIPEFFRSGSTVDPTQASPVLQALAFLGFVASAAFTQAYRYRRVMMRGFDSGKKFVAAHQSLADVVLAREAGKAQAMLADHLRSTLDFVYPPAKGSGS